MIRRFLDANRRVCKRIEAYLPQARNDPFPLYESLVGEYMNARPNQLVVDVGGGKSCPFAKHRVTSPAGERARIVAVDVSVDEIRDNRDVDEARVGDIMQDLPFANAEADLVVSRSVLEHLTNLESFIVSAKRVLKPGGYFIHLFPSRYAIFATINRALPNKIGRRLLYFFQPQVAGICGFPAFYDDCYDSAMRELLERHGFVVERLDVNYYQSRYFNFFVPLYLASVAYELIVSALGMRDLAAYVLVVARRPEVEAEMRAGA